MIKDVRIIEEEHFEKKWKKSFCPTCGRPLLYPHGEGETTGIVHCLECGQEVSLYGEVLEYEETAPYCRLCTSVTNML